MTNGQLAWAAFLLFVVVVMFGMPRLRGKPHPLDLPGTLSEMRHDISHSHGCVDFVLALITFIVCAGGLLWFFGRISLVVFGVTP